MHSQPISELQFINHIKNINSNIGIHNENLLIRVLLQNNLVFLLDINQVKLTVKKLIVLFREHKKGSNQHIYTDILEFENINLNNEIKDDILLSLEENLLLINKEKDVILKKVLIKDLNDKIHTLNDSLGIYKLKLITDTKRQKRIVFFVNIIDFKKIYKFTHYSVGSRTNPYKINLPICFTAHKNTKVLKVAEKSLEQQRDAFFTKKEVAKKCVETTKNYLTTHFSNNKCFWLEPSAGSGAFYKLLPSDRNNYKLGIDIHPKSQEVFKENFLSFNKNTIEKYTDITLDIDNYTFVVIGNPPFGKMSNLAIKFFNHAANFAHIIAFIVPKTFKKTSVINRLNRNFHLAHEEALAAYSFELNKMDYDVPCVFQIWEKKDTPREEIKEKLTHPDFTFAKKEEAHFAIQRVGVAAGKVKRIVKDIAPASHYFIKSHIETELLLKRFEEINWASVKYNTAGNPSISKGEIVKNYEKLIS